MNYRRPISLLSMRRVPFLTGMVIVLFLGFAWTHIEAAEPDEGEVSQGASAEEVKPYPEAAIAQTGDQGRASDYGDVTEEETKSDETAGIADPLEPFNRAMYHFNDKLYFWLLKPAATGYKRVVPEDFRVLFSNMYRNIKAPVRIINNLLQGKPGYAGREFARLVVNSTLGVAGLRDCAKDCFGITGRDADFGQTLGRYGVGFGFYIVWPVIGPSSPRDTLGMAGDWAMTPATYIDWHSDYPISTGLYTHEKVNYTSLHLGDYETLKSAAIDPYVSIRNAYRQNRQKALER